MTQARTHRSDATWDAARDAYLAGAAAELVCERFHLNLSTFKGRAARQKWRRSDQPDPEPFEPVATGDLPLPDMEETFRIASARVTHAVQQGRIEEALKWGRIMNLALRDRDVRSRLEVRAAEIERRMEMRGALSAMRGYRNACVDLHQTIRADLDAREAAIEAREAAAASSPSYLSHPVFPSPPPPDLDPGPQTRADRRRALREARKRG
ncbi:MAG: hypothetical protein REJ23_14390 [Brevundimonas sp.]|nr:hypothetical protein [Brevundimonas sp.]